MFFCFICKEKSLNVGELIRHLRRRHALYDGTTLVLKCFHENCRKTFQTFSGYRKHVQKCSSKQNIPLGFPRSLRLANKPIEVSNLDSSPQLCSNDSRISIDDYFSSYISKLYSMNLPDSSIQSIVDSTRDMLKFCLTSNVNSELIDATFSEYRSKFKREQFFKNYIVEPVQVPFNGMRYDQKWNKEKCGYEQIPISTSFMYIPILNTLKFILECNTHSAIFNSEYKNQPNVISNFSDGSIYKTNIFFKENKNAFLVHLYYDEFESVNPLGSKTGGHKIGVIYMVLKNLPFYYNSYLQNIHLVALFYSSDVKLFGINSVLDVVVKDLKTLETIGISNNGPQNYIKGALVALSHDNLGANQIFGMVESFSAYYYCRICLADKTQCQELCYQEDKYLRTDDGYEEHCRLAATSKESNIFGIKFRSSFNDLTEFKLCNNPSVDIMHDLLEGIVQLEIKLFLKHLISENNINLSQINERIKSFNFGMNDQCNKPSPICLEKPGHSIGQREAQTLCLLKYLPLILSDIICSISPIHSGKLKIIQLLLQIVRIVVSPINSVGIESHLTHLIAKHHKLYMQEYNLKLTPKHHMVTHYSYIILKMGPLLGISSMRFEAKHGYFKNLVHSTKNFKSLCKTLAYRHQEYMWHEWKN